MTFHEGPLPGEPDDANFAEIDDARVRYIDEGEGPPVVLLHGFAASIETWEPIIPKLAEDHRVIALDLKGFGWSNRPEGDYSPQAQAELVWELLDELDVDDPSVVAHSWGSSVALAMTAQHPDSVDRIALYDAWVYEEQLPSLFVWSRAGGFGEAFFGLFYTQRPTEKLALAFYDKSHIDQELIEHTRAMQRRPGSKAAALEAVRGQRFEKMQRAYSDIDQPVLLLWGREDKITTLKTGERLYNDLPNAYLRVYPQCGHFPMIEAQNASTRDLRQFLTAEDEEVAAW
ncbi:MAG: alpha/beta fold hydrolase [Persicimonas sp.]